MSDPEAAPLPIDQAARDLLNGDIDKAEFDRIYEDSYNPPGQRRVTARDILAAPTVAADPEITKALAAFRSDDEPPAVPPEARLADVELQHSIDEVFGVHTPPLIAKGASNRNVADAATEKAWPMGYEDGRHSRDDEVANWYGKYVGAELGIEKLEAALEASKAESQMRDKQVDIGVAELHASQALNKEQAELILEQNTEVKRLGDALEAERAEVARLEDENSRTYCAYCGASFVRDDEAATKVTEHIYTCADHPMRLIEAERDAALATSTRLAEAGQRCVDYFKTLRMIPDAGYAIEAALAAKEDEPHTS